MRWDSPLVLAIAGTAAIHTILVVFVDALVVTHPFVIPPPAPKIEMFEVEVEPPPKLKPPAAPIPPPPEPTPKPPPPTRPQTAPPPRIQQPVTPPPPETPQPTAPDSGGAPVVHIDNLAPDAKGSVPVVAGKGGSRYVGRGGSGTGTGAGSGSGAADAPPPKPVSIATIKTRAMPKGDYGYIDATRDYPTEARQLGIEGPIRVRLVVDIQGKVASAVLLNRLGHGLDELALDRARKIQFDPARDTDDKPVSSVVVWTFNMVLPKG